MLPVVGIKVKATFEKAHKSVLPVTAAQGPDELKAVMFFSVGRQHKVLVITHAQPLSPVFGKISGAIGPEHKVEANFQKVLPVLQREFFIA